MACSSSSASALVQVPGVVVHDVVVVVHRRRVANRFLVVVVVVVRVEVREVFVGQVRKGEVVQGHGFARIPASVPLHPDHSILHFLLAVVERRMETEIRHHVPASVEVDLPNSVDQFLFATHCVFTRHR